MLSAQLMAQGSMMWILSSLLARLQEVSTRERLPTLPQVEPFAHWPVPACDDQPWLSQS